MALTGFSQLQRQLQRQRRIALHLHRLHQHQRTMSSLDGQGPDSTTPNEKNITKIPTVLPHERVFPIQVGGEVFKLSGASLSSDAPSYFSQYFRCQLARAEEAGQDPSTAIRTLNIDRDPITFRDIALHLQGYHICPRDGTHFVRLFADAQFYSRALPGFCLFVFLSLSCFCSNFLHALRFYWFLWPNTSQSPASCHNSTKKASSFL